MAKLKLRINGEESEVEAKETALLLDVLRQGLDLTGTKRGCETSHCGACTVLLNGVAVHSCVVLAARCEGKEITTVEGLTENGELNPLQRLFLKYGGLQCGYCTPGMLMAATALLKRNPKPTLEEIKSGLDGNLCRCTGYTGIFEAIQACAENS
ncbi:MAG TPA: (2Fe-2S)-binding protein [Candidatus Udaeobacter sp.]|jgi:carbon-monoxide dehydrogenase small subunit|nr:(2Fe-2S)-binding protein [Candidatus Udaeobacter sp.]